MYSESSVFGKSAFTCTTFHLFCLCQRHFAFSTEVTLFFKFENHLKICFIPIFCFLKATFNILKVCVAFMSKLKQNLVLTCSYFQLPFSRYAKIANGTTHHVLNVTLVNNHTCYSFIVSRKSRLLHMSMPSRVSLCQ